MATADILLAGKNFRVVVVGTNGSGDPIYAFTTAATDASGNPNDVTHPLFVSQSANDTSAGAGGIPTTARLASAANSTNATNVKTSAGRIYAIQGMNVAAYAVYLVLYDSALNPPVPGTTTIRKKIPIPASSAFALDFPLGLYFATGIGFALTKLAADADTTVVAAGDVLQLNVDYV